jgi:hypothetical protein
LGGLAISVPRTQSVTADESPLGRGEIQMVWLSSKQARRANAGLADLIG